jgi:hypothetical protein
MIIQHILTDVNPPSLVFPVFQEESTFFTIDQYTLVLKTPTNQKHQNQ